MARSAPRELPSPKACPAVLGSSFLPNRLEHLKILDFLAQS